MYWPCPIIDVSTLQIPDYTDVDAGYYRTERDARVFMSTRGLFWTFSLTAEPGQLHPPGHLHTAETDS